MINLSQILPINKKTVRLNGIDKGLIEIGSKILAMSKQQKASVNKEA
ncbi:hypothetical protein [Crocinitomix catalasitica]|nr:hypothetical protein [Crocinitomix catalasitica]|tara:strand:- start:304 stop:444 length:141 start_codon:yes stop_codon:yes gene_type:complete